MEGAPDATLHGTDINDSPSTAPIHHVPPRRIVAIEHPAIVRNFDNGFKSLGGEAQMKHVLKHRVGDSSYNLVKAGEKPEPVAGVSLRPNDPLAKKIPSHGVKTRNVLVKVTLPKRTGRKRKRGSDDPFEHADPPPQPNASMTAPEVLQRLRENEGRYTVEALGIVRETHRFRTLPDFQLRNADIPVMRELRAHVSKPDYDALKDFRINLSPGRHLSTPLSGPPTFATTDLPHKFEYQQPPTVVFMQNEAGQVTTKNVAAAVKRVLWDLAPDIDEVPMHPPKPMPNRNNIGEALGRAINEFEKLLSTRPLVTKRVALNNLPPISDSVFKEAMQYVGYSFKAGPWRDSLIRYGVDPRKDPKYRKYQTLMFQLDKDAFKQSDQHQQLKLHLTNNRAGTDHKSSWARPSRHRRDDPHTHMFDGQTITANGKTWQICDITDPISQSIFATDDIRSECDVYQWGWYHNGTVAKARIIMKDKMRHLFADKDPPEHDYVAIANKCPNRLTNNNMRDAYFDPRQFNEHCNRMGFEIRACVKAGDLSAKSPRAFWSQRSGKAPHPEGFGGSAAAASNDGDAEDADFRDVDVGDVDTGESGVGRGDFDDDDEEDDGHGQNHIDPELRNAHLDKTTGGDGRGEDNGNDQNRIDPESRDAPPSDETNQGNASGIVEDHHLDPALRNDPSSVPDELWGSGRQTRQRDAAM